MENNGVTDYVIPAWNFPKEEPATSLSPCPNKCGENTVTMLRPWLPHSNFLVLAYVAKCFKCGWQYYNEFTPEKAPVDLCGASLGEFLNSRLRFREPIRPRMEGWREILLACANPDPPLPSFMLPKIADKDIPEYLEEVPTQPNNNKCESELVQVPCPESWTQSEKVNYVLPKPKITHITQSIEADLHKVIVEQIESFLTDLFTMCGLPAAVVEKDWCKSLLPDAVGNADKAVMERLISKYPQLCLGEKQKLSVLWMLTALVTIATKGANLDIMITKNNVVAANVFYGDREKAEASK